MTSILDAIDAAQLPLLAQLALWWLALSVVAAALVGPMLRRSDDQDELQRRDEILDLTGWRRGR